MGGGWLSFTRFSESDGVGGRSVCGIGRHGRVGMLGFVLKWLRALSGRLRRRSGDVTPAWVEDGRSRWTRVRHPALALTRERLRHWLLFGVLLTALPFSVGGFLLGFAALRSSGADEEALAAAVDAAAAGSSWRADRGEALRAVAAAHEWMTAEGLTDWRLLGDGEPRAGVAGEQSHRFVAVRPDGRRWSLGVITSDDGWVLVTGFSGEVLVSGLPCDGDLVMPSQAVAPLERFVSAWVIGDLAALRVLAVADGPASNDGEQREWPTYWQSSVAYGVPDSNDGGSSVAPPVVSYEVLCWRAAEGDVSYGVATVKVDVTPDASTGWVEDVATIDVRVEPDAAPVRVYGASLATRRGVG